MPAQLPWRRTANSFVTQGDHGVDPHRTPRRDVAGQRADSDEHQRNQRQSDRVVQGHVKEQALDEARGSESAGYPNRNANQRKLQRLAQDHAQN